MTDQPPPESARLAAGGLETRTPMAAAAERAVVGATITQVIDPKEMSCSTETCPNEVAWFVVAEHGDDDDGMYSCSRCLEVSALSVIEDEQHYEDDD
jgi:hypothetical protein